ncbi:MAG: hypothetical protein ACI4MS_06150 [Candidatus Coproplasma sp.]
MSDYELNRHKKSDKVKWVFTGIAFFLSLVLIVGLFLQVFGQGKVKPSEWFNTEQTETENEDSNLSSGGAIVGNIESNGISLLSEAVPLYSSGDDGVSTAAETAYVLTATVTPSNATYKDILWSINFKNSSSTWASGKTVTDYVTIAASGTNNSSCTVTPVKAFGEPIIITATTKDGGYTATCQVDYVKRISTTNITFNALTIGASNTFTVDNTYTDYTIDSTVTYTIRSLNVGGYATSGTLAYYMYNNTCDWDEENGGVMLDSGTHDFNQAISGSSFVLGTSGKTFGDYYTASGWSASAVNEAFALTVSNSSANKATLTVDYKVAYNGTTYQTLSKTYNVTFNASALRTAVTGVTVNSGNIIV